MLCTVCSTCYSFFLFSLATIIFNLVFSPSKEARMRHSVSRYKYTTAKFVSETSFHHSKRKNKRVLKMGKKIKNTNVQNLWQHLWLELCYFGHKTRHLIQHRTKYTSDLVCFPSMVGESNDNKSVCLYNVRCQAVLCVHNISLMVMLIECRVRNVPLFSLTILTRVALQFNEKYKIIIWFNIQS